MIGQIREFVSEQRQALVDGMQKFREESVGSMRELALTSADGIKSLKEPVRAFAHSGVRLATVSQHALQKMIELESEVVTSALSDAALRLERALAADGVVDLVLDQAEMTGATRERLVEEATRAASILKVAGRDVRKVGTQLYGKVFEPAEEELPKAKARARRVRRAVRKTTARVH